MHTIHVCTVQGRKQGENLFSRQWMQCKSIKGPRSSVLDAIADKAAQSESEALRFAIVGKRNSGKSTMLNRLAGEDRVIVSELPGTTRDAIDVELEHEGRKLCAIDTAGVRKKKSI